MKIEEIIRKIKQAKKYKALSNQIVEKAVESFTKKNPRWGEFKEKAILKEIKRELHGIYGSFQIQNKNITKARENLLKKLEKEPENPYIINEILETNKSTKERISIYSEIYEKIFQITGKPSSIIDLGCGLNPVSIILMGLNLKNNINYYAYDINEEEINFLNEFFSILHEKNKNFSNFIGRAEILDLSEIENIKNLPNADVAFCFKLLDVLEKGKRGHKYSEELIKTLLSEDNKDNKCKFVIASFATKTISNKNMNYPYRGWIERMLSRIGFRFEIIDFSDKGEVFYIIKK